MVDFGADWCVQPRTPGDLHLFRRLETRITTRTAFQEVEISRLETCGWTLILDGLIQSSEVDEHLYHELLVHPALLAHPHPRRVLVLGTGEGATAREILRHPSIEHVTMVDIDAEVVELCKQWLPTWNAGAFDDPRVHLVTGDAGEYLRSQQPGQLDAIIMDLTGPEFGPASDLYSRDFFQLVRSRLAEEGVFVTQGSGAHYLLGSPFEEVARLLTALYPSTLSYAELIPSFDELWIYVLAGGPSVAALDAKQAAAEARKRNLTLTVYDERLHQHVTSWPFFQSWK
jgi:spermidine synthase